MNKEIKERWVEALRSGEYKQGYTRLQTLEGCYCCLGVLCDLYIRDHKEEAKWNAVRDEDGYLGDWYIESEDFKSSQYLPPFVTRWAGIEADGGNINIDGYNEKLVNHNDQGRSFVEIAAAIERQL